MRWKDPIVWTHIYLGPHNHLTAIAPQVYLCIPVHGKKVRAFYMLFLHFYEDIINTASSVAAFFSFERFYSEVALIRLCLTSLKLP